MTCAAVNAVSTLIQNIGLIAVTTGGDVMQQVTTLIFDILVIVLLAVLFATTTYKVPTRGPGSPSAISEATAVSLAMCESRTRIPGNFSLTPEALAAIFDAQPAEDAGGGEGGGGGGGGSCDTSGDRDDERVRGGRELLRALLLAPRHLRFSRSPAHLRALSWSLGVAVFLFIAIGIDLSIVSMVCHARRGKSGNASIGWFFGFGAKSLKSRLYLCTLDDPSEATSSAKALAVFRIIGDIARIFAFLSVALPGPYFFAGLLRSLAHLRLLVVHFGISGSGTLVVAENLPPPLYRAQSAPLSPGDVPQSSGHGVSLLAAAADSALHRPDGVAAEDPYGRDAGFFESRARGDLEVGLELLEPVIDDLARQVAPRLDDVCHRSGHGEDGTRDGVRDGVRDGMSTGDQGAVDGLNTPAAFRRRRGHVTPTQSLVALTFASEAIRRRYHTWLVLVTTTAFAYPIDLALYAAYNEAVGFNVTRIVLGTVAVALFVLIMFPIARVNARIETALDRIVFSTSEQEAVIGGQARRKLGIKVLGQVVTISHISKVVTTIASVVIIGIVFGKVGITSSKSGGSSDK